MDYFYDQQIRRYLLQFIRIFADIKTENLDSNNNTILQRVPVRYGDMNRIIGHILKENSQNVALPSPSMGAWIKSLEIDDDRRNDTTFVSKINANERTHNASENEYGEKIGNQYSVERYMPVPYKLTMQLDIWTTSVTTKLQILEQILTIFNPTVQIQQNDNPIDWTSIVEVTLSDITWSSRSVPVGTDSERDVASLTFELPIWINPPAKVKRQKLIQQIHTGIFNINNVSNINTDQPILDPIASFNDITTRAIVTPGNYKLGVGIDGLETNEVVLLTSGGVLDPSLSWESLFSAYGNLEESEVTLRLKTDDNMDTDDGDILGTVAVHPTDQNKLIFTVDEDTLPSTLSLSPITAIINPVKVYPGSGLPAAAVGQKYLLISDYTRGEEPAIPTPILLGYRTTTNGNDRSTVDWNDRVYQDIVNHSIPWGSIDAWENDIIMYNGSQWVVIFDSRNETGPKYIKNLESGHLLKFNGTEWVEAYFGEYSPGYWRLEY